MCVDICRYNKRLQRAKNQSHVCRYMQIQQALAVSDGGRRFVCPDTREEAQMESSSPAASRASLSACMVMISENCSANTLLRTIIARTCVGMFASVVPACQSGSVKAHHHGTGKRARQMAIKHHPR